jgi:hypothetical protein
VEIVEHVTDDTLERYSHAVSASAGIRAPGRASADLFGVPGPASIHGSIRGGDAFGGGEDQRERYRRIGALCVVAVAVAWDAVAYRVLANELRGAVCVQRPSWRVWAW